MVTITITLGGTRLSCVYTFASLLSAACAAFGQDTSLTVVSEFGDYIGGGIAYSYATADGSFTATRNSDGGVSVDFHTPSYDHWWSLDFAAPANAPLEAGTYSNATRYPFQDITSSGLDVSGDGRGSNTLTGSFVIKKIIYGSGTTITSFSATFEQHSEGAAPALTGEIKFDADATGTPVNQAPGVYAGEDQRLPFGTTAALEAIAGDDGVPSSTLITTWSVVSGPGTAQIADLHSLQTTVTFDDDFCRGILRRNPKRLRTSWHPNSIALLGDLPVVLA